MAETVEILVKGGQATGGPPLGPALGPTGIKVNEVVDAINEKTSDMAGMNVPVKVMINPEDKSFEISIGRPPTSALLKKEIGLEKASQNPGSEYIADLPIDNIIRVARVKVEGLLAGDMKAAVKEVIGSCQSAGIKIEGLTPKEIILKINEGEWDDKIYGKVQLEKVSAEELAKKAAKMQAEVAEKAAAEAEEAAEAEAPAEEGAEEKPAAEGKV